MSQIDEKEIEKLMRLCRIALSEEEKKQILHHLKNLIAYFDQLKNVHTEGVPSYQSGVEEGSMPLRDDVVGETLSRDEFLANAPAQIGGMIKVPSVITF